MNPFSIVTTNNSVYVTEKEHNFTSSSFIGGEIFNNSRPILPISFKLTFRTTLPYRAFYIYYIKIGDYIDIELVNEDLISKYASNSTKIKFKKYTEGISLIDDKLFNFTLQIRDTKNLQCSSKLFDQYRFVISERIFDDPLRRIPRFNLQIEFARNNIVKEIDCCQFNKLSLLNKNNVIIPLIDINFQSLIDGSDIGNTIFTIIDEFEYYNGKTTPIIPNHNCKIIKSDNAKTTIFDKSCPKIISVLRGIGNTAEQKIKYLHENFALDEDFYNFYLNIVEYSMLKYLLSRILYGEFNINYILNNNNKKFIRNLGNSRFCNFVKKFTDPNSKIFEYDQYFL